jgi:imidazolonepropionase-like amidohydrolase
VIIDVGKSHEVRVPPGANVIDCTGKTVLPGFVMLHEHLFYTKIFEEKFNVTNVELTFPRMYLAGGVTTMRTAGSVMPYTDLNVKRLIEEGKMTGPTMDVTGPFIEREGFEIPQLPLLDEEESPAAMIDYWAKKGCNSFKVYMHITREDLKEVIIQTHGKGLKVTGHLCSVSYREAAELGIDNIEHGFLQVSDFVMDKPADLCDPFALRASLINLDKDDSLMTDLMRFLIENEVTITTTPAVFEPYSGREMVQGGGEAALAPQFLEEVKNWHNSNTGRDSLRNLLYQKELYWIRKFHDMGGKLVVGTDPTGPGRTIAGYANMRTFEILHEAGFSITEAVKLCTKKGAEFLGLADETGTVETGKKADLILIDGYLPEDVTNIRKIETVFKDGVGFDSKKIFDSVKGKVGVY